MSDICQNCKRRPATVNWVGEGGMLAFAHGMYSRWCERCATVAEIEHITKSSQKLPELQAKLSAIDESEP